MRRINNKILLIGFGILVAIFVAAHYLRSPALETNIRKELIKLDTAAIGEVHILPAKDPGAELKLIRVGKNWKVNKGTRTEASGIGPVKSLLGTLTNLQAQRVASRKKEKWGDFNVGETGTHVTVYQGGKLVADFHVGKVGFVRNSGGAFGGAYTYLRLSDENEVYTVDGFLESIFNNSFNDWRDKTFLKLNKTDITKLLFQYPLDSGFLAEKRDSVWFIGNEKTDPSKTENLLNAFSSKYLTEFVDGFTAAKPADCTVQVISKNGTLVTIQAWKTNDAEWVLISSYQKGIYFSNKGSNIINEILVGKKRLLTK